ncbi:MAG: transglutaminase family protein [Micavibrio aeruginosavorus]|uniref:Transglutaminase family protein n=1 Tax=Micavibrio aeruginosavorus TaxID=349221 RepID=A0A7T5UHZ9_9BACT|nr:MAG: transglutaminase family protein [Micavibrio aeruginosavorus]
MVAALEPVFARLREIGAGEDSAIDLGKTALLLSELAHPGIVSERYMAHIRKLGADVGHRYQSLLTSGAEDNAETQLAALKHILADQYGYHGDEVRYDDIRNADLIDVIERRKGMPITLAILYILAAQAQGWNVAGLNIPGHFVVRLEKDGQRLIFDPFQRCVLLNAPELRQLIKKTVGEHAELSASYFEPVGPRQILIRLQNNIKTRLIEGEDYERALLVVESMRAIDPHEYRLLLDEGVLCARTGKAQAAMLALEEYIKQAPDQRDRQEAAILLQHIRSSLH